MTDSEITQSILEMSVLRISTFSPHAESRMIFTARSVTIMRDRVDSREGVYKRANRRLSCHLEWTNSSLESLTSLPVRLSIARIVISDSSPRLLLRSHRLSILSPPPCPSFIRVSLPSPLLVSLVSLSTDSRWLFLYPLWSMPVLSPMQDSLQYEDFLIQSSSNVKVRHFESSSFFFKFSFHIYIAIFFI